MRNMPFTDSSSWFVIRFEKWLRFRDKQSCHFPRSRYIWFVSLWTDEPAAERSASILISIFRNFPSQSDRVSGADNHSNAKTAIQLKFMRVLLHERSAIVRQCVSHYMHVARSTPTHTHTYSVLDNLSSRCARMGARAGGKPIQNPFH